MAIKNRLWTRRLSCFMIPTSGLDLRSRRHSLGELSDPFDCFSEYIITSIPARAQRAGDARRGGVVRGAGACCLLDGQERPVHLRLATLAASVRPQRRL